MIFKKIILISLIILIISNISLVDGAEEGNSDVGFNDKIPTSDLCNFGTTQNPIYVSSWFIIKLEEKKNGVLLEFKLDELITEDNCNNPIILTSLDNNKIWRDEKTLGQSQSEIEKEYTASFTNSFNKLLVGRGDCLNGNPKISSIIISNQIISGAISDSFNVLNPENVLNTDSNFAELFYDSTTILECPIIVPRTEANTGTVIENDNQIVDYKIKDFNVNSYFVGNREVIIELNNNGNTDESFSLELFKDNNLIKKIENLEGDTRTHVFHNIDIEGAGSYEFKIVVNSPNDNNLDNNELIKILDFKEFSVNYSVCNVDFKCDSGENVNNCPSDCSGCNFNEICEITEDRDSCSFDCKEDISRLGNNVCDLNENYQTLGGGENECFCKRDFCDIRNSYALCPNTCNDVSGTIKGLELNTIRIESLLTENTNLKIVKLNNNYIVNDFINNKLLFQLPVKNIEKQVIKSASFKISSNIEDSNIIALNFLIRTGTSEEVIFGLDYGFSNNCADFESTNYFFSEIKHSDGFKECKGILSKGEFHEIDLKKIYELSGDRNLYFRIIPRIDLKNDGSKFIKIDDIEILFETKIDDLLRSEIDDASTSKIISKIIRTPLTYSFGKKGKNIYEKSDNICVPQTLTDGFSRDIYENSCDFSFQEKLPSIVCQKLDFDKEAFKDSGIIIVGNEDSYTFRYNELEGVKKEVSFFDIKIIDYGIDYSAKIGKIDVENGIDAEASFYKKVSAEDNVFYVLGGGSNVRVSVGNNIIIE